MPGTTAKAPKETKNQRRRAAKKVKKAEVCISGTLTRDAKANTSQSTPGSIRQPSSEVEIPAPTGQTESEPESVEPVTPSVDSFSFDLDELNPLFEQFKDVLSKFEQSNKEDPATKEPDKGEIYYSDDNEIPEEDENTAPKLSKKARKAQNKLSIAELKALVRKPETVDWTDTSAPDPRLLVAIKSHRNVVPVPTHWSLKREYLSSKRGVEKPPSRCPSSFKKLGLRRCATPCSRNRIRRV